MSAEKTSVLVMATDPEPRDGVSIKHPNRAVAESHSDRPDVLVLVNTFETQRWMKGVFRPQMISLLRPCSDGLVESAIPLPEGWYGSRLHSLSISRGVALPSAIALRAWWAASTRLYWVRANDSFHRTSSRRSSI